MIFDLERYLPAYTEKYIKEEMYAEDIVEKWIMVKNQMHMDEQESWIQKIQLHPNFDAKENKSLLSREVVPFPKLEKERKSWVDKVNTKNKVGTADQEEKRPKAKPKFDKKKAWEQAPSYNLGNIKNILGG